MKPGCKALLRKERWLTSFQDWFLNEPLATNVSGLSEVYAMYALSGICCQCYVRYMESAEKENGCMAVIYVLAVE